MAKQVFVHTRLSRAYLALARLSCFIDKCCCGCYSGLVAAYKILTYFPWRHH